MIRIIILIVLWYFLISYINIKNIKTFWTSKFLILETTVENIKNVWETQKIYQIYSSWFFEWKKMDFVSPKYYFDINDKIKIWDKIQVELNISKSWEYRFLDDKFF